MDIELLVGGEGLEDLRVFSVPAGASAREVIVRAAEAGAFDGTEAVLFIEDAEEPLDVAILIVDESWRGRVHHVHRTRRVEVVVNYQGHRKERLFSPAARVHRVLDWAVGPEGFNVDRVIAPEMELALHDSETPLPRSAHIGQFVRHPAKRVELDLIRGIIPNG